MKRFIDFETRRRRRQRVFAVLPTLLTLGNAACGFGSVTIAAKIGTDLATVNTLYIAALLIFAAMVFDALDGPVARITNQTTDFGAQLDSLCDAISFGVAPAFLMMKVSDVDGGFHPRLLWGIGVLYVLCIVMRLARFNVTGDDDETHHWFRGLRSPAAAGAVASRVIVPEVLAEFARSTQAAQRILDTIGMYGMPVVTLAIACLTVSRIRYPHTFNQIISGRHSYHELVKLIFAIVIAVVILELIVPVLFLYYVVAPPCRALFLRVTKRTRTESPKLRDAS